MSLRLIIADDEPSLRLWLRQLLAEIAPDAQVLAEAADGADALAAIESLRPDAALLDIRMPVLSGLEVASRLTVPCRIVFVTAHDEFALRAFEQAAVDYLLKPVTAERLARTLERLRQAAAYTGGTLEPMLRQLLGRLAASGSPAPLRWLRAGSGDSVQLIDVAEVDRFEATDKYTTVHAGERQWLIRVPLRELEQQLDPQAFWRIHRGTLVRVAAIDRVRRDLLGRLWIELRHGGPPVAVSRSYAHLFRQM